MNTAQFKKVARLLKEAYKELEEQALKENLDIFSEQFKELKDRTRLAILEKMGYSLEEYRDIKDSLALENRKNITADVSNELEAIKSTVNEVFSRKLSRILSKSDVEVIAENVAKKYIVPPQIINKIVDRETIKETIKKPTIIKETVKETVNVPFDPNPLLAEIGSLNQRLEDIKIPEPVDIETLKSDLKLDFNKEIKHNIDILGMPDFRKLAMGLQAQIDANGSSSSGGGSWGSITGTLSDQTDLQSALDAKQNTITGLTASGAELNILDGATLTTTELNYVDGVTSAIQTQLDGKQATLVSTTNIKTINGSSILGSGDLTVSASAGGSNTEIQFNDSGALGGDSLFVWDKTNNRLGVNYASPQVPLDINADGSGNGWRIRQGNAPTASYFTATVDGAVDGSLRFYNYLSGVTSLGFTQSRAGRVGIGIVPQGSRLAVNGNMSIGSTYASSTAPTNSLIIEDKLGIGTTNPATMLATSNSAIKLNLTNASTGVDLAFVGNGYARQFFVDSSGAVDAKIYEVLNFQGKFTITRLNDANTTRIERFIIATNGNVGIGETSPSAKLHIKGIADATQFIVQAHSTQSVTNPLVRFLDSAGSELGSLHFRNDNALSLGFAAGDALTSGTGVYIGRNAGGATTTTDNVVIGNNALVANSSGSNTIVGNGAGNGITGSENSIFGSGAGGNFTSGSFNTVFGSQALTGTNGNGNSAFGTASLEATSGAHNIAFGRKSASNITSGNFNYIFGSYVDAKSATANGQLNIGNTIFGKALYATASSSSTTKSDSTIGIGIDATTTSTLTLRASTTAISSLNIPAGTAPSSPVDGDIWFDGTDIKMRIGGVTKTFTLV